MVDGERRFPEPSLNRAEPCDGKLERMAGIEPATESLEDSDSTTELHPRGAEGPDRTDITGFSNRSMNHHCYLGEVVAGHGNAPRRSGL